MPYYRGKQYLRNYRRGFNAAGYAKAAYAGYSALKGLKRVLPSYAYSGAWSQKGASARYNSKSGGGGAAPLKSKPSINLRKRSERKYRKSTVPKRQMGKVLAQLKNQVHELKRIDESSNGQMTWRVSSTGALKSPVNAQAEATVDCNSVALMETALGQLKYYNPSTPGSLTIASGATGSYQKKMYFKSHRSSLHLRNNYQTDAELKVYLCSPRDDTDITPSSAWSSGQTDAVYNASGNTNMNTYPSDSDTFLALWNIKQLCHKTLSPGQSTIVSHTVKDIQYDPAVVDLHNLAYQKAYKNFSFLIVVNGVISHDSVITTEQGLAAAGVDYYLRSTAVILYDAGIGLKFTYNTNGFSTPTNGFVQSHSPVPDNIAYSIA